MVLCSPEGHTLGGEKDNNPEWMIQRSLACREQAVKEGGGRILTLHDPVEAVQGADFVYTGCFCYEGTESKMCIRDSVTGGCFFREAALPLVKLNLP